jgi:uracil-DNA glycosylase
MSPRPLSELVSADWAEALQPVAATISAIGGFLRAELAAGRSYLPAGEHVLRAFSRPLSQVKVLIVGQDPYPTPGHPIGLSFSVAPHVRPIPRSLQNIYAELQADLGIRPAASGDLTPWFQQGVLLLNRVLTVQPGRSGSHRGKGWEQVTQQAIEALVTRGGPLVAILWGRDAQSLIPMLGTVPYLASAHPSPLSAAAGFFGSRPFSRANDLLVQAGGESVDWELERLPEFASPVLRTAGDAHS